MEFTSLGPFKPTTEQFEDSPVSEEHWGWVLDSLQTSAPAEELRRRGVLLTSVKPQTAAPTRLSLGPGGRRAAHPETPTGDWRRRTEIQPGGPPASQPAARRRRGAACGPEEGGNESLADDFRR